MSGYDVSQHDYVSDGGVMLFCSTPGCDSDMFIQSAVADMDIRYGRDERNSREEKTAYVRDEQPITCRHCGEVAVRARKTITVTYELEAEKEE